MFSSCSLSHISMSCVSCLNSRQPREQKNEVVMVIASLSLLIHLLLRVLAIALHPNQPLPALLSLPQLPSGLPQPLAERLSGTSVGREVPDLELGLGSGSGEGEGGVGREVDGEDLSL